MLTGLAILERELGINDFTRHRLARRLAEGVPKAEARRLEAEIEELLRHREKTIQLLEDLHAEYELRHQG